MSGPVVRKTVKHVDTTYVEAGKPAPQPVKMVAMAAVIDNPWAGQGYVDDLRSKILEFAPALAEALVPPLLDELGGPDALEAYGKAAVVGVNGEIEQASGFIHTLRFGNRFRDAVGGTAYLSFTNRRAGPGTSIQIPMMHKQDAGLRSHYLTVSFSIEDAPGPDEIVVALGGAASGRAHPRIGNRYMDMEEMGITGNTGLGDG